MLLRHFLPVALLATVVTACDKVLQTEPYDRLSAENAITDLATAQACLEMGLCISFAGMLTYPTAQNLRDVAKEVPLDRLLVETDCPYLAPQPVRGKRNEPGFVAHTAAVLAGVKGISVAEIEEHTTRNAKTLFGLN